MDHAETTTTNQDSSAYLNFYSGPDLKQAARHTEVRFDSIGSVRGIMNAGGVALDILRSKLGNEAHPAIQSTCATLQTASDLPLGTLLYAGNGLSVTWVLEHFASFDSPMVHQRIEPGIKLKEFLVQVLPEHACAVLESPVDRLPVSAAGKIVAVPTWVRQRVRVSSDWSQQIVELKRGTRQEISRVLRKFGYSCRLAMSEQEFHEFYDELYLPFVRQRHGHTAIVVDRERFLRESRRGGIIQLRTNGETIAGAVVRRIFNTMAILWTGARLSVKDAGFRGTTDALDYFSLLYAHLQRCKWLDFGRSRPDLLDGTLRYKRKWGAEIIPGIIPQSSIQLLCMDPDIAVSILSENRVLITCQRRRLIANIIIDRPRRTSALQKLFSTIETIGIDRYRFVVLESAGSETCRLLAGLSEHIQVVRVSDTADAIKVLANH